MSIFAKVGLFIAGAFWIFGMYSVLTTVFNPQEEKSISPYHREINYPANARPLQVYCGDQPCVVFYDLDLGAAVALMLDGSTITVKPEAVETE